MEIISPESLTDCIELSCQLGYDKLIKEVGSNAFASSGSLAHTYCEIANFLLNIGQAELAEVYYKLSLDVEWVPSTFSLYLQCLLISPNCTPEKMYLEASKYNLFFSHVKKFDYFPNQLSTDRKLKIGYVCHFFHNSVSRSLLLPFIQAHDRKRVNVYCYSDTEVNEVEQEVKSVADVWRDTKNLDDDAFAKMLRDDEIDILLELNGHCIINRYGVLARKPVPIQVSFYNISATSGVSAIDYILVGNDLTLDKTKDYYSEIIYTVPGVTGVAKFPDHFPKCVPAPFLKNQFVTYGCFGAAHKVNRKVIQLWCEVLKRVPTARFYFKTGVFSHEIFINAYKKLFEQEGVALERIRFEGFSEHQKMLECYGDVDIALDTFPHGGGTTTVEALWQGVPVLSLYGEQYAMQHGKMILSEIGHSELVAYSKEEFVKLAIELANDPSRIINYRNRLRDDFKKSPKADPVALARRLEDAYCDMWEKHCR